MERFDLFFLEDAVPLEEGKWLRQLRDKTRIPLAQGELFTNPYEWKTLISEQLIDFIRVHISDIGGFSMARKLAAFCEFMGVRTAFHGPGDVSPIGHAANLHLDLASHNFGIQEVIFFSEPLYEVFPGTPVVKDGYVWANDHGVTASTFSGSN